MDDSWLNGSTLGQMIGQMAKPRPPKEGAYFTVWLAPDPWNDPYKRYLVIDAWSNVDHKSGCKGGEGCLCVWNDFVMIQIEGGSTRVMLSNELAGYRGKEFWKWQRETIEQRQAAAAEGMRKLKEILNIREVGA